MKKSYSNNRSTIRQGYGFDNKEEKIEFKKIAGNELLAIGSTVVGILSVKGRFGESYSLACRKDADKFS